mmetsp:Transcript_4384/g.11512  ORF Transcript_4384/g.11512 Transcript_4384/m.11512 type:complete len:99 (-) Transcript_4384:225-521(-)
MVVILPRLVVMFASPLRNLRALSTQTTKWSSPLPLKSTPDDASSPTITNQDLLHAAERGDMDTLTAWKTAFPQTSIDTIKDHRDKTSLTSHAPAVSLK